MRLRRRRPQPAPEPTVGDTRLRAGVTAAIHLAALRVDPCPWLPLGSG